MVLCGHVEEQCNVGSIILKHNLRIRLGIYGSKTKFSPMYPKYDIFAQSKLKRRKITFFILTYIIVLLRTAPLVGALFLILVRIGCRAGGISRGLDFKS